MGSDLDLQVLARLQKLGGIDLIQKMIALFFTHAESAIRDAANGLASGNPDAVCRAAHSLKSSAGNVGAVQVQAIADEIEHMAEHGTGEIQPLLTDLENAYLQAKNRLAEEMREGKQEIEDSDR
jgi:HPt (histidine-containing phosphotransfer) domain-containing protein